MMNGVRRQRVHVNRLKPCYRQLGRRYAVDDQGPQMGEPKQGTGNLRKKSKKSREKPVQEPVVFHDVVEYDAWPDDNDAGEVRDTEPGVMDRPRRAVHAPAYLQDYVVDRPL